MAVMKAVHPRVSFADMERWPEDGRRYELYDGEVYEVPSPIPLHQMVSAQLYLALHGYASTRGALVLWRLAVLENRVQAFSSQERSQHEKWE